MLRKQLRMYSVLCNKFGGVKCHFAAGVRITSKSLVAFSHQSKKLLYFLDINETFVKIGQ